MKDYCITGAGLGLRRTFIQEFVDDVPSQIDFVEIAPENWISVGGKFGHWLHLVSKKLPLVCHGLSLDIGGQAPLDVSLIKEIKQFLDHYNIRCYSEHLSYCADEGHLYDLLPIPFTHSAVEYVSSRIKQVQDIISMQMAIENVSYYAMPSPQMPEIEFLNAVLEKADCNLLLDVNNIYVNSINHRYDAEDFLQSLPKERIAYAHIAGHYNEADDLKIDTHGADVIEPVWNLLDKAYQHFGVFPTLLERDFNIPPLRQLLKEVNKISKYQSIRA